MEAPALSVYLIAAGFAFVLAQSIKYLVGRLGGTDRSWRQLYKSGRMPSGHTATVFALLTSIGLNEGVDGSAFAVAAVFALITAYDSVMSRRSIGEQGIAVKKLWAKSTFAKEPAPRVALGHTPLEVAAGALLGMLVGFAVVFSITK